MKREGFSPLFFVFTITIVHYLSCGIPARLHSFGIPAPVPSLQPLYLMRYNSPTPLRDDQSIPLWVKVIAFFWFVCYFGRFLFALIFS